MSTEVISVKGRSARGFSNGMIGRGRVLHVAGQIGSGTTIVGHFIGALENVLGVVSAAGGRPEDIASMTIFVTDIVAYRHSLADLGHGWRARMGKHYPAMALVAVAALVDPTALVEIQAVAYLPEE